MLHFFFADTFLYPIDIVMHLKFSFTELIVSFRGVVVEREVGPSFFGISASENCKC